MSPMTTDDDRHGTPSGYVAGCRERCCADAIARYECGRQWDLLNGRPRTVPAIGAQRRIHALQRLGWSAEALSRRLGHSPKWVDRVMKRSTIRRATHELIVSLYDELSMTLGPSDRTRRRAEQKGWLPPLAYDDDRIDDPNYRPSRRVVVPKDVDQAVIERVLSGERLRTTAAEKREIMRRWLASGRSERQLCQQFGWKEGRYTGRSVGTEAQPETPEQEAS